MTLTDRNRTFTVGDRVLVPGGQRVRGGGRRPDRVYTIYHIQNKWMVWCQVDPPLADGKKTSLTSLSFLQRGWLV